MTSSTIRPLAILPWALVALLGADALGVVAPHEHDQRQRGGIVQR